MPIKMYKPNDNREYTFFQSSHEIFKKLNNISGHRGDLSKFHKN